MAKQRKVYNSICIDEAIYSTFKAIYGKSDEQNEEIRGYELFKGNNLFWIHIRREKDICFESLTKYIEGKKEIGIDEFYIHESKLKELIDDNKGKSVIKELLKCLNDSTLVQDSIIYLFSGAPTRTNLKELELLDRGRVILTSRDQTKSWFDPDIWNCEENDEFCDYTITGKSGVYDELSDETYERKAPNNRYKMWALKDKTGRVDYFNPSAISICLLFLSNWLGKDKESIEEILRSSDWKEKQFFFSAYKEIKFKNEYQDRVFEALKGLELLLEGDFDYEKFREKYENFCKKYEDFVTNENIK